VSSTAPRSLLPKANVAVGYSWAGFLVDGAYAYPIIAGLC